jgi:hypothetical protein
VKKKQSKSEHEASERINKELSSLLKRKPVREYGRSFPLMFFDELSSATRVWLELATSEIHQGAAKVSSKLSNHELKVRMLRDGSELLRRADKGDSDAANDLTLLARNLADELNLLAKRRPALICPIAKSYDEWPVVLSLIDKAKDAESWQLFFREILKLGEDSFCCTNRGQKIDLTNIWNRYVWFVLKAMRLNKLVVPDLREKCNSSLPAIQQTVRIGRTILRTWFYELREETVMITEWAALCCDLPVRLTNDDAIIRQFMKPLKLAVLEYWLEKPGEYEEATSKVKLLSKHKRHYDYRSLCFTQMVQHLRTLAWK